MKLYKFIAMVVITLFLTTTGLALAAGTLETVQERGSLKAGVNGGV